MLASPSTLKSLRTSSPGRSSPRRLKRWCEYLTLAGVHPRNRELLTEFFLEQFAYSPAIFPAFLVLFQRTLTSTKARKARLHLAQQYLDILSPLCERFGLFEKKNILDRVCFRLTNPKGYRAVEHVLSRYRRTSHLLTMRVLGSFRHLLKDTGHTCTVTGRYKNVYSVSRKLRQKRYLSPIALNDIFAFRIILQRNSVQECFDVLNLLHDRFQPSVKRFKDYISIPKINGYQSIHTTLYQVLPDLDLPVEVQIRTKIMDDFAERGVASHWLYAGEKKSRLLTDPERKLVEYLTSLSEEVRATPTVLCFSPTGDAFRFPAGSTILDFAYAIHTEVGHRARSAAVNGTKRTLQYALQEGDRIHVLTARKIQATKDWLSFAHTPYARRRIREQA